MITPNENVMVRKAGHRNLQMRYTVFKPETAVHCPLDLLFLASELGYKRVVIAQDTSDRFSGTHVWAVVNGKCYDPLFYNTAKPKRYLPVFKGSTQKQYTDKTHCTVNGKFRPGD